jgi:PAS domain S-box-containing protein
MTQSDSRPKRDISDCLETPKPDPPSRDELAALHAIVEGTARHTGQEFFQSLVRHLAAAVGTRYAFVAEFAGGTRARTLAFWFRDQIADNIEWDVIGTPCEEVVRGNLCHHPAGVSQRFPQDKRSVGWGIDSYLGVPLLDVRGRHLGHLAVFDERPMPAEPRKLFLFRIFAARAAAELERLQFEETLRTSEERRRLILDNAHDAFIALSADGLITEWNRQAEIAFGWPRAEAVGRLLAETVIPPQLREAHRSGLARFLATGEGPVLNRVIEVPALRRDGGEFPAEISIAPVRLGEQYLFAAFVRDVTERKRTEEELRRAKEAAEAANRAKDEFLANVSHEIRTPMNAILGITELTLDTPLTEDQRQYLTTVKSAADALLGIINDILDFAKIEAGRLELDSADFSLRSAVSETLRALAVRAHKKGLELIYQVQPDVPDALVGDAGRLRQVLLNLVGNALKFTERGEVVVRVEVAGESAPEGDIGLRFTVRDTGIGIPPEKQARIFQAFEQEDTSTTRKYGGTGLGLTIASRLVALMGGAIRVESEPGRGSTFAFTARFALQPHPPEPTAASPPAVVRPATPESLVGVPLRILVAEDNEFNRDLLEHMLARLGLEAAMALNGRETLALLQREPFDLLLLDIHMPELDGFGVVAAIRQRERTAGGHLPVIALTARSRQEDRERCLAAGMDDYLAKPFTAAELWAAIARVVQPRAVRPPPRLDLLDAPVLLAACGGDGTVLRKLCRTLQSRVPGPPGGGPRRPGRSGRRALTRSGSQVLRHAGGVLHGRRRAGGEFGRPGGARTARGSPPRRGAARAVCERTGPAGRWADDRDTSPAGGAC